MSRKDLIHVSTQLAIMIDTGVTLSDALDCIAAQSEKPNVKRIVQDVCQEVQAGVDFSTALQRHPRAFPRLFVALISASEKSGMMAKLLQRATGYLRDEHDTIRRVRGALTYPAIMLGFAIGTTTFLLAFVSAEVHRDLRIQKGRPPRAHQNSHGHQLRSSSPNGRWFSRSSAQAIFGVVLASAPPGRARAFHYVQLQYSAAWRPVPQALSFARTAARRHHGRRGVSLVDCVKTAHDLTANSYFKDLWDEVSQQIQAGKQFSEPLFRNSLVPRSVSQMLHSAERSGKLAQVMEQVSGFAEEELKQTIADLTRYIEPIMIAVMGGIIGSVVLALMLPIFTISKVIVR